MNSKEYEHKYSDEYNHTNHQDIYSFNQNESKEDIFNHPLENENSEKDDSENKLFQDYDDDYPIKKEAHNSNTEKDISLKMPVFERIVCKTPKDDNNLPDVFMMIFFIFLISLPLLNIIKYLFENVFIR